MYAYVRANIYTCVYIYMFMSVCVCMCLCMCLLIAGPIWAIVPPHIPLSFRHPCDTHQDINHDELVIYSLHTHDILIPSTSPSPLSTHCFSEAGTSLVKPPNHCSRIGIDVHR